MEFKPVFKTIVVKYGDVEERMVNGKIVKEKVVKSKEVKYFSREETMKEYADKTVNVGGKSYPIRVTVVQKPAEEKVLYSNMQEKVLFYYIDPEDGGKMKVVKEVIVEEDEGPNRTKSCSDHFQEEYEII